MDELYPSLDETYVEKLFEYISKLSLIHHSWSFLFKVINRLIQNFCENPSNSTKKSETSMRPQMSRLIKGKLQETLWGRKSEKGLKQDRNLEARADAEAEECCLLVSSLLFAPLAFLENPGRPVQGWHHPQEAGAGPSPTNHLRKCPTGLSIAWSYVKSSNVYPPQTNSL